MGLTSRPGMTESAPSIPAGRVRFLDLLDTPTCVQALMLGSPGRYTSRALIVREGEPAHHVLLVEQGWATASTITDTGQLLMHAVAGDGDLLGVEPEGRARPATVTAGSDDLAVRLIPIPQFVEFLGTHPTARAAFRATQCAQRRLEARRRLTDRRVDADVRVARMLLHLYQEFGRDQADEGTDGGAVTVPLSRRQMGALIGSGEPAVRRALAHPRWTGILRGASRGVTIIDPDRLEQAARLPPSPPRPCDPTSRAFCVACT